MFTDPEVAAVGLTTREAGRAGRQVKVVDYDIGGVAGTSQHADEYRGKTRMLVDLACGTVAGGAPSSVPECSTNRSPWKTSRSGRRLHPG
ncbi:hypothetical protein [Streptomyces sp. NPDC001820]|uniref:hypothetical protein n=1 Tax=Streptomyces sp. NPDC001820 TaxID=3364613 RepID=UPI0036C356C7